MGKKLQPGTRVRFSFLVAKGFAPITGTGVVLPSLPGDGKHYLVKRDNHWSEHDCLRLRRDEVKALPLYEEVPLF